LIAVEIVRKNPDQIGFAVKPRRWVVERFFAWIGRNRRLAKDFEATIDSARAFLYAASVMLPLRRIARASWLSKPTLSRYLLRADISSPPSFAARVHLVETTGPILVPAGIEPGLVHAAVKEAVAATFLSSAISKQRPLPSWFVSKTSVCHSRSFLTVNSRLWRSQ
jgi:hypothetical protein